MSHVAIPRAAVERLRELLALRDKADAEARGLMAGLAWGLGLDPERVTGIDDGDEPALVVDPEQ